MRMLDFSVLLVLALGFVVGCGGYEDVEIQPAFTTSLPAFAGSQQDGGAAGSVAFTVALAIERRP